MMRYGYRSDKSPVVKSKVPQFAMNEVPIRDIIESPYNRSSNLSPRSKDKRFSARPQWMDTDKLSNSQNKASLNSEENSSSTFTSYYSQNSNSESLSQSQQKQDSNILLQSRYDFSSQCQLRTEPISSKRDMNYSSLSQRYSMLNDRSTQFKKEDKTALKALSHNMILENAFNDQKTLLQDIVNTTKESISEIRTLGNQLSNNDLSRISLKDSYSRLSEEIKEMRDSMKADYSNLERVIGDNFDLKKDGITAFEKSIDATLEKWTSKLENLIESKFEKLIETIAPHRYSYMQESFSDSNSTHCSDAELLDSSTPVLCLNNNSMDCFVHDIQEHDHKEQKEEPLLNDKSMNYFVQDVQEHDHRELNEESLQSQTEVQIPKNEISTPPVQPKKQNRKRKDIEISGFTPTSYPIEWVTDPNNVWLQVGVLTRSKKTRKGIEVPTLPDEILMYERLPNKNKR